MKSMRVKRRWTEVWTLPIARSFTPEVKHDGVTPATRREEGRWRSFLRDEEGLGTLEMLLILAVVVIVAIAFRKWIMKWVGSLFKKADSDIQDITGLSGGSIEPSTSP